MTFDPNSNTVVQILNSVLKNINEDISHLREDFKKLNDLVIVLSVKVEDTKSIRYEIKQLYSKVEAISNRIFELEKAKEKLEHVISQVDKDNKTHDTLFDMALDERLKEINNRIKGYDDKLPWLKKILLLITVLLIIILYVTKSYGEVFHILFKVFSI